MRVIDVARETAYLISTRGLEAATAGRLARALSRCRYRAGWGPAVVTLVGGGPIRAGSKVAIPGRAGEGMVVVDFADLPSGDLVVVGKARRW